MRFHVLGIGSIGTLISHHLRRALPTTPISLIVRKGRAFPETRASIGGAENHPSTSLSVERDGQKTTTDGFDVEIWHDGKLERELFKHPSSLSGQRRVDSLEPPPNGPIKSLIVCLKTPHTLQALSSLKSRIEPSSVITLLQNGMGVYDELCSHIWTDPKTRPHFIIGTTTHGVAKLREQGSVRHNSKAGEGEVRFGIVPNPRKDVDLEKWLWGKTVSDTPILAPPPSPSLPLSPPPLSLSDLAPLYHSLTGLLSLSALSPSLLPIPHLHHHLLLKLALNSIINPITAIIGAGALTNGTLLIGGSPSHRIIRSLAIETSAVLTAYLRSLSSPHAPAPDILRLFASDGLEKRVHALCKSTAQNTSSMAADVSKGQVTEVKHINGYLISLGQRLGVATPNHRMVQEMVKFTSAVNGLRGEKTDITKQRLDVQRVRRSSIYLKAESNMPLRAVRKLSPRELDIAEKKLELKERELIISEQQARDARRDARKAEKKNRKAVAGGWISRRAPGTMSDPARRPRGALGHQEADGSEEEREEEDEGPGIDHLAQDIKASLTAPAAGAGVNPSPKAEQEFYGGYEGLRKRTIGEVRVAAFSTSSRSGGQSLNGTEPFTSLPPMPEPESLSASFSSPPTSSISAPSASSSSFQSSPMSPSSGPSRTSATSSSPPSLASASSSSSSSSLSSATSLSFSTSSPSFSAPLSSSSSPLSSSSSPSPSPSPSPTPTPTPTPTMDHQSQSTGLRSTMSQLISSAPRIDRYWDLSGDHLITLDPAPVPTSPLPQPKPSLPLPKSPSGAGGLKKSMSDLISSAPRIEQIWDVQHKHWTGLIDHQQKKSQPTQPSSQPRIKSPQSINPDPNLKGLSPLDTLIASAPRQSRTWDLSGDHFTNLNGIGTTPTLSETLGLGREKRLEKGGLGSELNRLISGAPRWERTWDLPKPSEGQEVGGGGGGAGAGRKGNRFGTSKSSGS